MINITTDKAILQKVSYPVQQNDNLDILIKDMKQALQEHPEGVALSAIQLGVAKRVILISDKYLKYDKDFILKNPEILSRSDENILAEEGCLSFPNVFVKTRRSYKISVKSDGFQQPLIFSGLIARAIQHEIDHLDGILMFEREIKEPTQSPNETCNCGSGKKYKKCCGFGI